MPPEADPVTPEPTPDPAPEGVTPPAADPPDPDAGAKTALAAERKARADAEKAVKAANAELERLRKAQMSDNEKALEEAKAAGRKEATAEQAAVLVAAKIETALTGKVPDPAAVVDDLNLAKFINEDGTVNTEAITALSEKYGALAVPAAKPPPPGVPAGARPGDGAVKQLGRAEMKAMSSAEIVEARKAGQFDDLMAGKAS